MSPEVFVYQVRKYAADLRRDISGVKVVVEWADAGASICIEGPAGSAHLPLNETWRCDWQAAEAAIRRAVWLCPAAAVDPIAMGM